MKINKLLSIVLILITLILIIYFIFKTTKSDVNDIDICDRPVVSLVIIGNDYVTIRAGIYAYGDIVQDGVINDNDVKFLDLLLNSKLSFSDSQKLLADLNHDDVVDSKDLEMLKNLIKNGGEIKYDIQSNLLEYGISTMEDGNDCNWQSNNKIEGIAEGEYYAFVRIKNTDKKSLPYRFKYENDYEEEE